MVCGHAGAFALVCVGIALHTGIVECAVARLAGASESVFMVAVVRAIRAFFCCVV